MLDIIDVFKAVHDGKLVGYEQNSSFITMHFSHPELEKNQYYYFKFLTANQKIISATIITMLSKPWKQYGKEYDHLMISIVKDAIKKPLDETGRLF